MEWVELGDLISQAKVKRCGEGSFPVLSMTMHDGIVEQSERFKKQLASKDQSNYKIVEPNQLVVGFPIDEGVLYVQNLGYAGIMSPAYNVWDVDSTCIEPRYLELTLHSPQAMNWYAAKLRGTTARRRTIPANQLKTMKIVLPSIERQCQIVQIFCLLNDCIRQRKQQLEMLDDLVKSRFIEMFGDLEENPKRWSTEKLASLGELKNGVNFKNTDSGYEIKCLGVGDFKNRYSIVDMSLISTASLSGQPNDSQILQDGDVMFVRSNGNKSLVGRCLAVFPGETRLTFSGFCIRFRNRSDGLLLDYLLGCLKSDSMRRAMTGRGANIQNLSQGILSELLIPLPPIELQQEFADFVAQVDKLKAQTQQSIDKLQMLYDSLAQEYFGGDCA